MMSEKILACPYCGSEDTIWLDLWDTRFVKCKSCGAYGPTANCKTDAILLWNAAANQLVAKDAEIKQLRDGIAELSRDLLRETKRVDAAANALAKKDAEIKQLSDGIAELSREYELLRDEHELLTNEYKRFADNARAEIVRLTAALADTEEQRHEAVSKLSLALIREVESNKRQDELEAEIEQLRKERHTMCVDYERVEQEHDELKAEITEHRRHVATLMQREANAIAEIERQRLAHSHWYYKCHDAIAERDEARRVARHWYKTAQELDDDEYVDNTSFLENHHQGL